VVFGLLIITVMFVAPTGLAGVPGRVLGAVARRLPRTAATATTASFDRTPEAGSAPDPEAPQPVGAPPRTEKE
jgi:branched-chain amino acid transport system permease protein